MKTASIILRGGPVNKPEEKRELWREDYIFSEQNGELIEKRETYIDNEETRLFRKNIGRGQNPQKTANRSSNSQSSVSTTSFTLRRRPAGSSEKWEELWRKEVDRSSEDGSIKEIRETYLDEPQVRNFRERIGSISKTPNNPVSTPKLIEHKNNSANTDKDGGGKQVVNKETEKGLSQLSKITIISVVAIVGTIILFSFFKSGLFFNSKKEKNASWNF